CARYPYSGSYFRYFDYW
nr:immunoglobulin heavy chain junction region [Macaca mulatta]MOX59788.1 immunoglobulin heavy chain junction region [Macaca mulatta]MOX60976.1 immunoglobulin heavy chain junction region [Macaca mulatta]MOX61352.1 immunoglobulin heavy chain junction region [Macaca mulatta]MOX64127.1 immunoglobulin heavy chain junction region [Macaca mulatta]